MNQMTQTQAADDFQRGKRKHLWNNNVAPRPICLGDSFSQFDEVLILSEAAVATHEVEYGDMRSGIGIEQLYLVQKHTDAHPPGVPVLHRHMQRSTRIGWEEMGTALDARFR